MAISGTIIEVGSIQQGVSKAGKPWKSQIAALETGGQYSRQVAFKLMNDRVDQNNLQVGQMVEIEVDASSRKYKDNWYTELTAYRINNLGFVQQQQPVQNQAVYQQTTPQGYTQPYQQAPAEPVAPQNPAPQSNPYAQQDSSDLPF